MPEKYQLISENNDSTVVSDYVSPYQRATSYQSEAELERELIEQLQAQAYEYLPIKSESDLIRKMITHLPILSGSGSSQSGLLMAMKILLTRPSRFKKIVRNYCNSITAR